MKTDVDVRAVPASWSCMSCSRIAAPAPFDVWRVELGHELASHEHELLDAEERARAARFAFEPLRRRYCAAHVALRRLLASGSGTAPAALRFEHGPHGKPRLAGAIDAPAFNLSDSDDVALIALAPAGEIGVDVEGLRPIADAVELAAAHFCTRESAWLAAVAPAERDRSFLRVWAAKEACLKALGSGLSLPAASFDGGLGHGTQTEGAWQPVTIPTPSGSARVEWTEIDAGPDCVAALARWVRA